tara:strand:- start:1964 stop:3748 length:1785 start_codon:yes stop_codon:yes gene_type:complete
MNFNYVSQNQTHIFMSNPSNKRRLFLRNTLLATGGIILIPNFISCSNDDDLTLNNAIIPDNLTTSNFELGVASFDPTSNQVIIWTHYTTDASQATITYELSTDINFNTIVRSGEVITDGSRDFTVSVEVQDLEAGQKLYYRFANLEDNTVSVIGETITLPSSGLDAVSMGVVSCANYAAGLFNVYDALGNSDVDIIVHLGDYIYEYGENQYGTNENTVALGRVPEPNHEIVSLDDYRQRYRQYRSDAGLQLAHQKKPFIAVWDDHEITNDTYQDGAQNHQDDEGDFETRKQAALQAYSEYLPAMTNDVNIIYRSFKIGDLADLIMLDTRLVGRDKQLDFNNYFGSTGSFDFTAFGEDLVDANRSMLGAQQKSWFQSTLANSSSKYQVIGQQVLMGKMFIPAELIITIGTILGEIGATGSVSAGTTAFFQAQLTELVTLKLRVQANDPTLTTQEIGRVSNTIPYNLDAWDGYLVEREELMNSFVGKDVVVLAGDTHNAWYNDLTLQDGTAVGKELATASVSSPGFEGVLGGDAATITGFQQAMTILIDGLNYFNATERGYLKVTLSGSGVQSDWIFIDTIASSNYIAHTGFSESF